jgi:C-terminal processing protease CtpA/Prc
VQCIPDSPASLSKIEPGEVIVSVNGTDCTRLTTDELADILLGPEGEILDPCLAPQFYEKNEEK